MVRREWGDKNRCSRKTKGPRVSDAGPAWVVTAPPGLPYAKGKLLQHLLEEGCANVGQRASSLEMGRHQNRVTGSTDAFIDLVGDGKL